MNNQYKDRDPYSTIKLANLFFLEREILITEQWHDNADINLYSVSIGVGNISTNGKGVSKLYALASAYGELMERVQNKAFFYINSNIENMYGEELISDYCVHSYLEWYKIVSKEYINIFSQSLFEKFLLSMPSEQKTKVFTSLDGKSTVALPNNLLSIIYGSNGMVAGNSETEAYVQGLSEILERYVAKIYIEEKQKPIYINPESLNFLENFSFIVDIINKIESTDYFSVKILDLSMGTDIPAIGIILINKRDASYFVKIGVHPIMEIAIERCFTEMFQGRSLIKYSKYMTGASHNKNIFESRLNYHNFYVDGRAAFPIEFFWGKEIDYDMKKYNKFKSNKDMKKFLVDLIYALGYEIFVINNTVSDIYAFHFLVPGISEVAPMDEKTLLNYLEDLNPIELLNTKLLHLEKGDVQIIVDYIDNGIDKNMPLDTLIYSHNFLSSSEAKKFYVLDLYISLNIKLERYDVIVNTIRDSKLLIENNKTHYNFYYCLKLYCQLKIYGYQYNYISAVLSNFYKSETLNNLNKYIDNPLCFFNIETCLDNCFSCKKISTEGHCQYKLKKELYLIV
ncbi:YcaO-like family protein [Anaeropeptidivorans aminofermentans]|uniref:YcaO-like family protein n=1 Tax=Anaeropeptidivorans aminofermentans TaxID=2934315 RepID=UPI0020247F09|nr:YcaO-like family protein [Anaeropeptidivorans aminofermentans]